MAIVASRAGSGLVLGQTDFWGRAKDSATLADMKPGPGIVRQASPIVLVISGNDPSNGASQCADVQAITTMSCDPAADIGLLRQVRELNLPVAAIGGIDATNGARLIEAGANMLAVINAVFGATDSCKAAGHLSILFERSSAALGLKEGDSVESF